jgi:type II restriction/modification system DNA methylase subunit YeeA
MPANVTPQDFVAKWRRAALKESAAAKEHFLDLCRLLDQPTPADVDAEGTSFTFEYGAAKLGGGQGFADVFKRGFFGWEYKGKHANLERAYQQLLQYRESLHNPPLLVVCDIETIVVHPNFVNQANRPTTITLDDLLTPAGMARLRAIFTDPSFFESGETPESVTQRIAGEFAQIADRLRAAGNPSPAIAHFLIRLLFCLFAEDVGLLPDGLFTRLVERTRRQPDAFAGQLRQLFAVMATGGWFGVERIPHFNGGLFDDDTALALDRESLDLLARVVTADWGAIEPSIFGTLFERSLDPDKRSQLGAHYTSREDILLIVEPVLMAPLRRRWAEVQEQVAKLAAQRDAARGAKRTGLDRRLQDRFVDFAAELAAVTVLDPACGSGNFLYIALRGLLDLWKEVYNLMAALKLTPLSPLEGISPTPGQLYGIEINAYAHELAQTTIWIGYLQWLRDNGFGSPSEPILRPIRTVQRMDAIITLTPSSPLPPQGEGQGVRVTPAEPVWPEAFAIIGNPPFLGGKRLRTELGDAYVDDLFRLYDGRVPREADLVCYWFEKARAQIAAGKAKRAGLLATQGIRGGANRKVLERIKETGDIFWAWSDRPWILEGAAVRVSMVGFDGGADTVRELNGQLASHIHANLTAALDLTAARRLPENFGLSFMGDTKGGAFDIPAETAAGMLAAPLNPNGRSNSDVVRPWVNGMDITGRSRGMWIIDFGSTMSEAQAALYEQPFEYVRKHVKPERDKNNRQTYRERWWIHAESRPAMRAVLESLPRFIATVTLAKHRLFACLPSDVLPDHQLIAFARSDDYFFGVLHSRIHELWALRMGTALEDRPRYTPTTCFETFPCPWPPGREPADDPRVAAIAAAASELVRLRDAWLNPPAASETELKKRTLTHLYNQRPAWLDLAHKRLDAAVLAAYGWPADLPDDAILERLLALNLARAGG